MFLKDSWQSSTNLYIVNIISGLKNTRLRGFKGLGSISFYTWVVWLLSLLTSQSGVDFKQKMLHS